MLAWRGAAGKGENRGRAFLKMVRSVITYFIEKHHVTLYTLCIWGDLQEAAHETVPTIRFWTKEGLLDVAEVAASGYQLYAPTRARHVFRGVCGCCQLHLPTTSSTTNRLAEPSNYHQKTATLSLYIK